MPLLSLWRGAAACRGRLLGLARSRPPAAAGGFWWRAVLPLSSVLLGSSFFFARRPGGVGLMRCGADLRSRLLRSRLLRSRPRGRPASSSLPLGSARCSPLSCSLVALMVALLVCLLVAASIWSGAAARWDASFWFRLGWMARGVARRGAWRRCLCRLAPSRWALLAAGLPLGCRRLGSSSCPRRRLGWARPPGLVGGSSVGGWAEGGAGFVRRLLPAVAALCSRRSRGSSWRLAGVARGAPGAAPAGPRGIPSGGIRMGPIKAPHRLRF